MSLKLLPLAAMAVILAGCSQAPVVAPEPPMEYADPIVPQAPIPTTEKIKETSVLERSLQRGGAAIRMNEDADVLASWHYEAPNTLPDVQSEQNERKNVPGAGAAGAAGAAGGKGAGSDLLAEKLKSLKNDHSIYTQKDHSIYPLKGKDKSAYVQSK